MTPLAAIASDDRQMCDQSPETQVEVTAQRLSFHDATYVFDSCTILIARLETLLSSQHALQKVHSKSHKPFQRLWNEKFVANLLHLYRRLQTFLFLILIRKTRDQFDALVSDDVLDDLEPNVHDICIKEWPGGRQPFGTTWPWNIRPSLVVLWVRGSLPVAGLLLKKSGSLLDVLPTSSGQT